MRDESSTWLYLPVTTAERSRFRAAVVNAIRLADDFANGFALSFRRIGRQRSRGEAGRLRTRVRAESRWPRLLAAHAAADALRALDLRREPEASPMFGVRRPILFRNLADVTADLAARSVFTAAFEAVGADGHCDEFVKAAIDDYEKLLRLDLGSYPQVGKPIDPSSNGPLGALCSCRAHLEMTMSGVRRRGDIPSRVAWIEEERAYNFSLYAHHADG